MKTKLAIIVLTAGVVIGGGVLFWMLEAPPPRSPAATTAPAPAPAPAPETPPAAETPAPRATRPAAGAPAKPTPAPDTPVEAAPTTGTLVIESDVPDTSVFIDRVYLGTAPVTAENLAPGPHRLNMSASGYDAISETIDVAPGTRTLSIKFKDIKLDEQIAVVHKHAMGSCTGTLRATPEGLTYDTANDNDRFTAALTALETFEVDYLKKNLKAKIRGGKTYNFAPADGNADRLYLFHQAVDRARQRLLAGK